VGDLGLQRHTFPAAPHPPWSTHAGAVTGPWAARDRMAATRGAALHAWRAWGCAAAWCAGRPRVGL